ncbi:MAG: aminotransferase class V-fold PLP-dependent enzyme [bacterium]|nr:aminotransferase class V-fold PLP-dependent enzyme [bacterium]
MIYLDYNATTPLDPQVADAMDPYLREHHGNPSSAHGPGRTVRAAVDRARDQLGRLIGCAAERIVFTSGGSEANNQALKGIAWARGSGHVITSAVEHPSVAKPCRWLEAHGFDRAVAPRTPGGAFGPAETWDSSGSSEAHGGGSRAPSPVSVLDVH